MDRKKIVTQSGKGDIRKEASSNQLHLHVQIERKAKAVMAPMEISVWSLLLTPPTTDVQSQS